MVTNVQAQIYDLRVGDIKYISLKPPINNSYINQANWGCDSLHVKLSQPSTAGAIIEVTHYFEGSATIKVFVQYVWYDNWGNMHVGGREYAFLIRCIAASSSLNYTSVTLGVNDVVQLMLSTSGYSFYTPKWSSSNYGVAQVSYNGLVTARGIGIATITCDPIVGPPLSCHVTVKNFGGDGDEGGEGGGNDGGSNDDENDNYEERLTRAKNRLHQLQECAQTLIDNNRL